MEEQLSGRAIKRRRAEWKAQARREWEPVAAKAALEALYAESGKPVSIRDQAKFKRLNAAIAKLQPKAKLTPAVEPATGDSGACKWCGAMPPDGHGKRGDFCGSHFRRYRENGDEYWESGFYDSPDIQDLMLKHASELGLGDVLLTEAAVTNAPQP